MNKNKIEIIYPRALYGTNRIEKLGTAITMESRNPTLVRILEEKETVIENRLLVIPIMIRKMKKYRLPSPKFYEEIRNKVVEFCKEPNSSNEIRKYIGIETKRVLSRNIIKPLIASKKFDYINKKSVNAKNQKTYFFIKN